MLPKYLRLYTAGVWAGYIDPHERTAEEWWERVGDFGLDDARQALDSFIEAELKRLQTDVVNSARKYRKSARLFSEESDKALDEGIDPDDIMNLSRKIDALSKKYGTAMRRDGKLLDEAIDRLEQFEEDYALDSTGKSLE